MAQPLVIAYHLIWTGYGWWLPNDPRGSGSTTVRSELLKEFGGIHHGRKQIQPASREVRSFYAKAHPLLQHSVLIFNEQARNIVGEVFGQVMERERYTCYACAIMPDHVHLLIRKHKHLAEEMIEVLKESSRAELLDLGLAPEDHPVWTAGGGWKVFLEHPDEVRRTIRYIEKNPLEIRLPEQKWRFVKPYDGWPLHPGHSPHSPYAKALRAVGRYP
jgi:REP element-mobilizing transposase RayT